MNENYKCKNPNGCTCGNEGCACCHDHDTIEVVPVDVDNNGYSPSLPYRVPIQDFEPYGNDNDIAAPVVWPSTYVGDLDSHAKYIESCSQETSRLMHKMLKNYKAPDSYVCTKDNKLAYSVINPASGRFMYAMEVPGSNDVAPVNTILTFTENNGLRHAGMNEDDELIDMGPITNPVLVGPESHPQALVVPIANIAAVSKAKDMLNNVLTNFIQDQNQAAQSSHSTDPDYGATKQGFRTYMYLTGK